MEIRPAAAASECPTESWQRVHWSPAALLRLHDVAVPKQRDCW